MPKVKKPVYRIGDKVIIVNPQEFIRVGYDYTYAVELEQNFQKHRETVMEFARKIGLIKEPTPFAGILKEIDETNHEEVVIRRFMHTITHFTFPRNRPSRGERKLFTRDLGQNYIGIKGVILDKRVVKTGHAYPASGGQDYWGEHHYESGGLKDERTHVILHLELNTFGCEPTINIEAANVSATGEVDDRVREDYRTWKEHPTHTQRY